MREIKILHIYSDALDLYGDYFNVSCVKNHLEGMGLGCRVDYVQLGDEIRCDGYDMVYIGHGKARNLVAVADHFRAYGDTAGRAIEDGKLFFVTGNARLLFGKSFAAPDGSAMDGIGIFDYTGAETGKVFTADIVGECIFDTSVRTYGFVNRTQYIVGEPEHPLFRVLAGPGDSDSHTGYEGTLYKNFFGTWQMGPILPRNPGLLREILRRIAGEDFRDYDDALERKALELTLSEFKGI